MITKVRNGTQRESHLSRYTSIGFILAALAVGVQSAATAAATNPLGASFDSASNAAAASICVDFAKSPQSTTSATRGQLTAVRVSGFPAQAAGKRYQVVVGKSDGTSVSTTPLYYTGKSTMDLPLTSPVDLGAIVFVSVTAG